MIHASRSHGTPALLVSVLLATHGAAAQTSDASREGIWKAVVPARPMHGELDDLDPVGVAAGARVKTDCSLNWVDPDDGKRYCFASGTSLEMFLLEPHAYIARARAAFRRL